MASTRDDVIEAVARAFAPADRAPVLEALDHYGTEPHERERERVQIAILELAAGDRQVLSQMVQAAKRDYRDVLMWADAGPMTAEEGARQQAAARDIIERWGKP
ncbi:MAG: hypothetical protein U1E89_02480 [Burkholderiaceae bacterium]